MAPRALLAAAALLALAGCGYRPAFGRSEGLGSGRLVLFGVTCRACTVTWSDGMSAQTVETEGVWHKAVKVPGGSRSTVTVTLSAAPRRSGAFVEHAYIEYQGRRVAEKRQDHANGFGDQVTISAVLPASF